MYTKKLKIPSRSAPILDKQKNKNQNIVNVLNKIIQLDTKYRDEVQILRMFSSDKDHYKTTSSKYSSTMFPQN